MDFEIILGEVGKVQTGALVYFLLESEKWPKSLETFDKKNDGGISKLKTAENFSAKSGEILIFPLRSEKARKIILLGLGKRDEVGNDALFKVAANIVGLAKKSNFSAIVFDWLALRETLGESCLLNFAESLILANYEFDKYKSQKEDKKVEKVILVVASAKDKVRVKEIVDLGQIMGKATNLARDLVNEPPQVCTPEFLAKIAKELESNDIKIKVLDFKDCQKLGMNAFLAVAKGSEEAPRFIHLEYSPGKVKSQKSLAWPPGQAKVKSLGLVGKGITFDTGGLSLKSAQGMETMKLDMAGAAAVLGVFRALQELKPQIRVVGVIACCENMPSGKAIKPGDIIKSLSGKTIEILNTDAEGRVTLADSLYYASLQKVTRIVDLATLTGACMVALGERIAGLMGNNSDLTAQIKKAAAETGEKVWELPLEKNYHEEIKSAVADVKNSTKTKYAGAITAGLFLQEFIGKIPWAHLDIAGPSFAENPWYFKHQGATGFGVRTMVRLILNLSQS